PPPVKLSQSSIETLAVVAYRQPVTRGEIETIRGVSAEAGINKLLERELIYITGRADAPGRPIQYGTTDQFLEFVGIKSLDELPASDVLSSRQIDDWLKNSESAHAPNDTDMGLADEQLPLEAPVPEAAPNSTTPDNAAQKGETDYAVMPIENSTEGSVREALDSFVESDLKIVAQIYLEINHALISNSPLEAIERVYSKDQALAQCRHWLQRHLPHAQ